MPTDPPFRGSLAFLALLALLALLAPPSAAQTRQTADDEYTRYELLDPASAKFRILYDVSATTPGAKFFFNPIRKGSEASDESVFDRMTGASLQFEIVDGAAARSGGVPNADPETAYIKVELPRPVPTGGEVRLLIDKTYRDPKSYLVEGDEIVFSRSLGIKRNSVVLPVGYELVGCNVPSQVLTTGDGRVMISFINPGPDAASLVVRARKLALLAVTAGERSDRGGLSSSASFPQPASSSAPLASRLVERAAQTREIDYFLRQPETHAFDLYHDYTETREGVGRYLNVVRAGSTVSNPSALVLDTGERLVTRTLRGEEITRAEVDIGEPVRAETEVVVIDFPPVTKGRSVRLRIAETYTDSARYRVEGDELIWDRSFGRPQNAVVLPSGWYLTHSAVPATVSLTDDGRVRLDFVNPASTRFRYSLLLADARSAVPDIGSEPTIVIRGGNAWHSWFF